MRAERKAFGSAAVMDALRAELTVLLRAVAMVAEWVEPMALLKVVQKVDYLVYYSVDRKAARRDVQKVVQLVVCLVDELVVKLAAPMDEPKADLMAA